MQVAILGTGDVGASLAEAFAGDGHEVLMGSRDPKTAAARLGSRAEGLRIVSHSEAASAAEIVVLATNWGGVETALGAAGSDALDGKVLIDVTNPLAFPQPGSPPVPALAYPESAGRRVQEIAAKSRVVKCFNTVNARLMRHPEIAGPRADMFLCGNDADAKTLVADIARSWGWTVHDMGDIDRSYLLECLALVWIAYGFEHNHWEHAFAFANPAPNH